MASPLIYFISGSNRGIGLALVNEIASRDMSAIIYAGTRDPSSSSALQELAGRFEGRITVLKYEASNVELANATAETLGEKHGRVDVVIAGAGIQPSSARAEATSIADVTDMFEVNVIGVLILFQALFPLLKSSSVAKFIPITSSAGSLTYGIEAGFGLTGYGASKAALNYVARKIHFENEWITCFPLAPGIVATDMLANFCKRDATGELERLAQEVQMQPWEAAKQLAAIIEQSKRATHGGEFINFNNTRQTW